MNFRVKQIYYYSILKDFRSYCKFIYFCSALVPVTFDSVGKANCANRGGNSLLPLAIGR